MRYTDTGGDGAKDHQPSARQRVAAAVERGGGAAHEQDNAPGEGEAPSRRQRLVRMRDRLLDRHRQQHDPKDDNKVQDAVHVSRQVGAVGLVALAAGAAREMNHSTIAERTTTPASSTTSTGTAADRRPRESSSADQRATSSGTTEARAETRPTAGLRNFASSRRTTGTKPSRFPNSRAR